MKTKLFSIGILLFCFFGSQAQGDFSIDSGANYSTTVIKSPFDDNVNFRWGYYFAASYKLKLNDRLAFIPELQYSMEGYNAGILSIQKFRFNYIRVLPHIQFKIIQNLWLGAGLNGGLRTSATVFNSFQQINFNTFIEPADLGLLGVVRYYVKNWYASVRYNHGLKIISEFTVTDVNGNPIGSTILKNRNIQLGVGYSF